MDLRFSSLDLILFPQLPLIRGHLSSSSSNTEIPRNFMNYVNSILGGIGSTLYSTDSLTGAAGLLSAVQLKPLYPLLI